MRNFPGYLAIFCLFLPPGCISEHSERVADLTPMGWMPGDTVWVEYENKDTLSRRDISILIRSLTVIDSSVIDLTVFTVTPDSIIFQEPFSLLIDPAGKDGKQFHESIIPYRFSSRLNRPGTYRFGFLPGKQYDGLSAIGIKLG